MSKKHAPAPDDDDVPEIAIVGELGEDQADLHDKLLAVPPGGDCILYFNSPGGDPYCALSLMTLIRHRRMHCVGVVTGECSSAALWPLAACQERWVTPMSVFLFHPLKWESGEHIGVGEARAWAAHFDAFAKQSDELLAQCLKIPLATVQDWNDSSRYVTGAELAETGCVRMIDWP